MHSAVENVTERTADHDGHAELPELIALREVGGQILESAGEEADRGHGAQLYELRIFLEMPLREARIMCAHDLHIALRARHLPREVLLRLRIDRCLKHLVDGADEARNRRIVHELT